MSKMRLDNLLVDRGFAGTRARARAMILAGEVYVGGKRIDKAGQMVDESAEIEIKKSAPEYVSRGGIKLAHALSEFGIDVGGYVCVDIGASTGGFADCLLKNGAKKVYAIDVGYGQLDFSLRNNPRVVVLEKFNIRNLDVDLIKDPINLVVIDVSFIGLEKVFPKVCEIFRPVGAAAVKRYRRTEAAPTLGEIREIIALIKPQFQVGKGKVGKGGVVRDEASRQWAVESVKGAAAAYGWRLIGITPSPIKGPKGNIEYLAYWSIG